MPTIDQIVIKDLKIKETFLKIFHLCTLPDFYNRIGFEELKDLFFQSFIDNCYIKNGLNLVNINKNIDYFSNDNQYFVENLGYFDHSLQYYLDQENYILVALDWFLIFFNFFSEIHYDDDSIEFFDPFQPKVIEKDQFKKIKLVKDYDVSILNF
jgi:hypothetical protein